MREILLTVSLLLFGLAGLAQESAPPPKPKPKKVWTNDDFPSRPAPQPEAKPEPGKAVEPSKASKAGEEKELTAEERQKRIAGLEEDIRLTTEYIAHLRERLGAERDDNEYAKMRAELTQMEEELARMQAELETLRNPPPPRKKRPARTRPAQPSPAGS